MINDKITVGEQITLNGKEYKSNGANIIGEVEVILESKKNGKAIFTRNLYKNDLLVTGAVFISEKINNMRSTFKPTTLDVELGVHTADQITSDHTTISGEHICGLMVGNAGCGDTYNSVYKIDRTQRSVSGMIPFRVVELTNDLKDTDRDTYILRVVKGDYAYYYGKRFDVDAEINVQYEDGTTVPISVDTGYSSKFVKVFTKYSVRIDQSDVREYFKITEGSTLKSLINSIGLISGYEGEASDGGTEFFNVRGVTAFNMENHELKDSESTITVTYRLHVQ